MAIAQSRYERHSIACCELREWQPYLPPIVSGRPSLVSGMSDISMTRLTSIEICAGAGGQALGLEQAGFDHHALVEIDHAACNTLKHNRPKWNVLPLDVREFDARPYNGVDLLAGGVPCPPFSHAGKQLGDQDERNLFPEALRLVKECLPKFVMLENVRGLLDPKFQDYREFINHRLDALGYHPEWNLLHAASFGVPQLRPRVLMVAKRKDVRATFSWPETDQQRPPPMVGDILFDLMRSNGWKGAAEWRAKANAIAPTVVGGSKKHGGPDLGPTRAKRAWAELGVDGNVIANEAPLPDFHGMPRLTVQMVALIQGFPPDWEFCGNKTAQYRQVGNAFPPPVARAVGSCIANGLRESVKERGVTVSKHVFEPRLRQAM